MPALATTADVEALLLRDLTLEELPKVERLLELASGVIRNEARQKFDHVTGDTLELHANGGEVWLPERPVLDVTEVTVDGAVLDPETYQWTHEGWLGPAAAHAGALGFPWFVDGPITVTYDHGFVDIPDDVAGLCALLVFRQVDNPSGLRSERFEDAYEADYGPVGAARFKLTGDERTMLTRYRRTAWSPKVSAG